jgi:hypothetical protein
MGQDSLNLVYPARSADVRHLMEVRGVIYPNLTENDHVIISMRATGDKVCGF